MKILIINQPLANRGDESAHRAFVNNLTKKYPQAEILVLFHNSKQDIEQFRVKNPNVEYKCIKSLIPNRVFQLIFRLYVPGSITLSTLKLLPSIRNVEAYYKQADLVVCAPGGICLGGFQDWSHAAMLKIAKDLHLQLAYFARSIGPFNDDSSKNRKFKAAAVDLLSYCKRISLRDEKSLEIAASMGIDAIKTIDSAFLKAESCQVPDSFLQQINGQSYMVLVPNSLVWHYQYKHVPQEEVVDLWVALADRLLYEHPSLKIAMLPQTIGYSKKHPDGYIFFDIIKNKSKSPERIIVLEEQYGSDIQQTIISSAKLLIGARYHSIVFAINQGVPFVSLSYEHKMNGLLKMIDQDDSQVDINLFFSQTARNQDELIENIIVKSRNQTIANCTNHTPCEIATKAFNLFFDDIL